jgi:hypothetical protein
MAMGKKSREEQQPLWVNATDLTTAPGHPFYEKLSAASTTSWKRSVPASTRPEWAGRRSRRASASAL